MSELINYAYQSIREWFNRCETLPWPTNLQIPEVILTFLCHVMMINKYLTVRHAKQWLISRIFDLLVIFNEAHDFWRRSRQATFYFIKKSYMWRLVKTNSGWSTRANFYFFSQNIFFSYFYTCTKIRDFFAVLDYA